MKNLTLITILISSISITKANQMMNKEILPIANEMHIDEIKQKITKARNELKQLGYSADMMNNLFGDENLYFPSTKNKLNTVVHIIDNLIANDQYVESDRIVLQRLAQDAYSTYNQGIRTGTIVLNK